VGLAATLAAFLGCTLPYAINIPTLDDYDCGLDFLVKLTHQPTAWAKVLLLLSTQNNEYKTILQSGLFWLQYALFGKLNFRLSMIIGDLFPVVFGLLLWKLFTPRTSSPAIRLALSVPAALLFFQLNYAEGLNSPMTALFHLPAVLFAFLAIFLLNDGSGAAFAWSIVALLLGTATATSAFLVVPIGVVMLVLSKRYARVVVWVLFFGLALVVCRFHYHSPPLSLSAVHVSLLKGLILKPVFALAVLGSAAWPLRASGACALGLALVIFNLYLLRRGYFRRHPVIGYCEAFLLFIAMGIAQIRLTLGFETSIASRYRMYSDILLVFAWFAIAEEFVLTSDGKLRTPLRRNRLYVTVMVLAVLNAAVCDYKGHKFFKARYEYWTTGVAAYQHPEFPGSTVGPVLPLVGEDIQRKLTDVHCRKVFGEAIAAGVYAPPQYPRPTYPLPLQRP
jgi:hypothetical protein